MALEFLRRWQGVRFQGGAERLRQTYPAWVNGYDTVLRQLTGKPLIDLSEEDLYQVLRLTTALWERGIPPTTFGKLLHFMLPETVLMWDKAVVRTVYRLDEDPCSFLAYQCFGRRLLRHITSRVGKPVLLGLENDHAKVAGYYEPTTRIIDHLAYSQDLAQKAVDTLGGGQEAFMLDLPLHIREP